jgi:succinate dehydrogenase hydrophobic anchor subunit
MGQPVWKAIDIAFLFFVLMHALTGAYVVVTDWERFYTYRRALAGLAIVIGVGAFIYGTQTILAFQPPV